MNVKPKKFTKSVLLLMDPKQHKALRAIHKAGGPSVSEAVRQAIQYYLTALDEIANKRKK